MWFRRRHGRGDERDGGERPPAEHESWRDAGIGDEVEAFLSGRLVDHMVAKGRTPPPWAALNRVAHSTHHELVQLVAGRHDTLRAAPGRRVAWAETERFLAAHLLANSGSTPEGLARIQSAALVPLELALIGRSSAAGMTATDVLDAGSHALDSYRPGA